MVVLNSANAIFIDRYESPVGTLLIGAIDTALCLCDWQHRHQRLRIDHRLQRYSGLHYQASTHHPVLSHTKAELDQYFAGIRQHFTVPLQPLGTVFQQQVWRQLSLIPYGEHCHYSELALRLNKASAVRAVANANAANALSIFIPCHRVVAKDQSLGGYAGGVEAKKYLLTLEKAQNIQY